MKPLEDQDYEVLVRELASIDVPQERLAAARTETLRRHQQDKRIRMRAYKSLAVVALLVLVFVTSIRVSPVFASTVAKIPGFAPLVHMITYDKGIADIIDHDYYEEIGTTQSKNGLTFTLQGVIADESGMILPYTLSAPFTIQKLDTKNVELRRNGEALAVGISFSWHREKETKIIEENIEITAGTESINYQDAQFEFYIQLADVHNTEFTIPFELKKPIAKTKVYEMNEVLSFEGQNITVKSISISPLRTGITIAVDPHNELRILGFDDLRFFDENGEEWSTIMNGLTAKGNELDGETTYFMQSNYFREPKKLTLQVGEVKALPKGEDYIEVDFAKNKVLYQPSLPGLKVYVRNGFFTVIAPTAYENKIIGLLGTAIDANGQTVNSISSSSSQGPTEWEVEETTSYKLDDVVNPVRIYFSHYEHFLDGIQTIAIPLK